MTQTGGLLDFLLYVTFGSDQFEPYRATYSWGANQMAHAMMGFFLATVWYRWTGLRHTLGRLGGDPIYRAVPFLIPALKVIPDYLYARYFSGSSAEFPFFDAREFFWDKITDLSFWYLGMTMALALFAWPWAASPGGRPMRRWGTVVLVLGVMLAWCYHLMTDWLEVKGAFDDSRLPMIYKRLLNYPPDVLDPSSIGSVAEYFGYLVSKRGPQPSARHLIISGGSPMNRSMLAVSLGSEYTARGKRVFYTPAVRLIEDLGDSLATTTREGLECVLIDDLHVMLRPELTPLERQAIDIQSDLDQGRMPPPGDESLLRSMAIDTPEGRRQLLQVVEQARARLAFQAVLERVKRSAVEDNIGTIWVLSGKDGDEGFAYWRTFIKANFAPDQPLVEIRLK